MEIVMPDYVDDLKKPGAYLEAPKKIKLIETQWSYVFLTDIFCYKIKKTGNEFASPAVKEAYCHEECQLLARYNPNWHQEVVELRNTGKGYMIGGNKGEIKEYALKMETLSERRFLSSLLKHNTVDVVDVSLIAQRLAKIHDQSGIGIREGEASKADGFRALCDDMLYQMKRYFPSAVTQPIIDMIRHPLEKYIDTNKNLFNRRLKKGRVVIGHGALIPEHIHVQSEMVHLLSPQEVSKKYSILDAANDVATLMVQFMIHGRTELAEHFLKKYNEVSRDKDLEDIISVYQTYSALMYGVRTCEEKVASGDENLGSQALEYFNLATRFSRELFVK